MVESNDRSSRALALVLVLMGVGACAAPRAAQDPAECAELVAAHMANPSLPVDVAPRARRDMVVKVPRGNYRVTFVVDETGRVDPGRITVVPTPPDVEELRAAYARSTYFPARVADCAVPALVTRTIGMDSPTP